MQNLQRSEDIIGSEKLAQLEALPYETNLDNFKGRMDRSYKRRELLLSQANIMPQKNPSLVNLSQA